MKSDEYWKNRYLKMKVDALKDAEAYQKAAYDRLQDVQSELESLVDTFATRYANEDGSIDMDQAKKLMKGAELEGWQGTLDEWEAKAKAGGYDKELNLEYYRSRVSRLKALEAQMKQVMAGHATKETPEFEKMLAGTYKDTYYKTIYNGQMQLGSISGNFAKFNDDQFKSLIGANWQGSDFSKKLWGNMVDELPETLMKSLNRGALLGYSTERMIKLVKGGVKDFNHYQWHRLITTEAGHAAESATFRGYEETGVDEYEYLATLESRTCAVCRELHEKVFETAKGAPGVNYPLMHPNCRCTTAPTYPELDDENEPIVDLPFNTWAELVDLVNQSDRDFAKGVQISGKRQKNEISAKMYTETLGRVKAGVADEPLLQRYVAENGLRVGFDDELPSDSYAEVTWYKQDPRYTDKSSYLRLNPVAFSTKRAHRKAIEAQLGILYMPVSTDKAMDYIVTHELGHLLHNALYENSVRGTNYSVSGRADFIASFMRSVYTSLGIREKDWAEYARHNVSAYGNRNQREMFAELYAAFKLGVDTPLVQAFGKELKRWH